MTDHKQPSTPVFYLLIVAMGAVNAWWCARVMRIHGDLLYLEGIYRHLSVAGRTLADFQFPEATFFLPDAVSFLTIRLVAPSFPIALTVYALLFFIAYALILHRIFVKVWRSERSNGHFLLGLLGGTLLIWTTQYYDQNFYWPNHHSVLPLLFLAYFYLLYEAVDDPIRNFDRCIFWLCVGGIAMGISDLLAVPTVFAPIFVWASVAAYQKRMSALHFVKFTTALVSSLGIGVLIQYNLRSFKILRVESSSLLDLTLDDILNASTLPYDIVTLIYSNAALFAAFAVLLLVALKVKRQDPWKNAFAELALLSFFITASTAILTGRWDIGNQRYLNGLLFFPLQWMIIWGIPQIAIAKRWATGWVIAGLGTVVFGLVVNHRPLKLFTQSPLGVCVDKYADQLGSPWGLAGFWIARDITFTGKKGLYVNQVDRDLKPYIWLNAVSWYQRDFRGRFISKYTYFISPSAKVREKVILAWGQPADILVCAGDNERTDSEHQILLYPKGMRPLNKP